MAIGEIIRFCFRSLFGYPLRTGLMLLAMAIGVMAVVVLTALGEGARRYVEQQFTALGTHLLIVLPGRSETVGGPPPLLGQTPRDLTMADAMALYRSSAVHKVAPIMVGAAPTSSGALSREAAVLGSTSDLFDVRELSMAQGRFLPESKTQRADAICVLGDKLKQELFGNDSPLGRFVRIGERRFRVIGLLSRKGQSLGLDMSDVAVIPVVSAEALFNNASLFRILVQARSRAAILRAKTSILDIIRARHDGEDDITVITQDAMLATFDRIFAVSQRTAEIGLLKAIGSSGRQIQRLFLFEATLLSAVGAGVGLLLSGGGVLFLEWLFPSFPITVPSWSPLAAVGVAFMTGMVFGVLPARQAARLNPVAALSRR